MLAGSDTSGSFFRSFFIAVLTRPEIYKELIDELLLSNQGSSSTNLETEEELNGSFGHGSGSGMSLLDACIKETLRCYPPAPQPFSRLVGPGGLFLQSAETTISSSSSASKTGVFVPEGTEMTGAMVLTNCDPSIYGADAEAWNPSRWIECGREKVVEMDKYLQTFGYGTRLCLGKPIAELEIELGLKKVSFTARVTDLKEDNG
jgi:cytochrome P450